MNQIEIDELTEAEMIEQGWRFTGTRQEPRWQREVSPGKTEYYYKHPSGRKRHNNGSSATGRVEKVILTSRCWSEIRTQLDRYWDGRETAVPILGVREGREVFLIETVDATYLGDERSEHQMRLKDSPGYRAEEFRQANGLNFWYLSQIHTHPVGNPPLPSDADKAAFSCRTRKEAGDVFVGLIISPEEGGVFHERNLRAYVCEPHGGTHRTVPVPFEIEDED
jgi:hypothetical protein